MWPFRRRPPRIPLMPDEQWRQGDIAECISDLWPGTATACVPRLGHRAMVLSAQVGEANIGPFVIVGLQLLGLPDRWDARGFRKVVLPAVDADRRVEKPVEVPA